MSCPNLTTLKEDESMEKEENRIKTHTVSKTSNTNSLVLYSNSIVKFNYSNDI